MFKQKDIPIKQIKMDSNSRLVIKNEPLVDLMASIRESGQLQPIGLVRKGAYYETVWGNRRFEALRRLGRKTVNAFIVPEGTTEDRTIVMNLVENIQRKDVSPHEQGRYFEKLATEFKLTYGEIAARCGISSGIVARYIRLFKELPENMARDVVANTRGKTEEGKITPKIADAIIRLKNQKRPITKVKVDRLYELAKEGKIGAEQISYLSRQSDLNFENVLPRVENIRPATFHFLVDRKKAGAIVKAEGKGLTALVMDVLRRSRLKDVFIDTE